MKPKTILIAILSIFAVTIVGGASLSRASQDLIPKESKEQPAKVKLASDSVDDKWGEVAFDHTNHATKNYTIDGKGAGTCIECHHTDQPKENLKAPLVTSERKVALTAEVLKDAAATPVKSCRSCHLQAGDDSKPLHVAGSAVGFVGSNRLTPNAGIGLPHMAPGAGSARRRHIVRFE